MNVKELEEAYEGWKKTFKYAETLDWVEFEYEERLNKTKPEEITRTVEGIIEWLHFSGAAVLNVRTYEKEGEWFTKLKGYRTTSNSKAVYRK